MLLQANDDKPTVAGDAEKSDKEAAAATEGGENAKPAKVVKKTIPKWATLSDSQLAGKAKSMKSEGMTAQDTLVQAIDQAVDAKGKFCQETPSGFEIAR